MSPLRRGGLGRLGREFFSSDPERLARDLLGRYLVRRIAGARRVLRIVETEAYLGVEDPASHSYGGRRTERTETMYREGGAAYVYFIYGIHHCLNVVAGAAETAGAVLVRAGEPVEGEDSMLRARGLADRERVRPGDVAGGPGKLCQALEIDRSFDGASLLSGAIRVAVGEPVDDRRIEVGPRVGIDYAGGAAAWPLRFGVRGCRHVSKPRVAR